MDRRQRILQWRLYRRLEKLKQRNPELNEELNSLSHDIEKLNGRPNKKKFATIRQKLDKIRERASSQTLNSNENVLQNGIQNGVNSAQIEEIRKDLFAMLSTSWVRCYEAGVENWIKHKASFQELLELKNELENFLQHDIYNKGRLHHYAILTLSSTPRRNGKVDLIFSQNEGKSHEYSDAKMKEELHRLEQLFAQIGKEGNYMPGFEFKVTDPDLRKKLADIIYLGRPPQTEHPLYLSVDRDRRVAETRYGGFTAYVVGDTFNQIMRIALGLENAPAEQVEARLREYQNGERIEIGKRYR